MGDERTYENVAAVRAATNGGEMATAGGGNNVSMWFDCSC